MSETVLDDCEELLSKLGDSQTVHEESGDFFPELHVVAAASPDPAMATYTQGKEFCTPFSYIPGEELNLGGPAKAVCI